MSLYNKLFGFNKLAPALLECLNLDPRDIPRFRDCFIQDDTIVVHTRTGGGNREEYQKENAKLAKHPDYLYDSDDEFDCTYANFFFRFPKEFKDELERIAEKMKSLGVKHYLPSEKWKILLNSIKEEKPNEI